MDYRNFILAPPSKEPSAKLPENPATMAKACSNVLLLDPAWSPGGGGAGPAGGTSTQPSPWQQPAPVSSWGWPASAPGWRRRWTRTPGRSPPARRAGCRPGRGSRRATPRRRAPGTRPLAWTPTDLTGRGAHGEMGLVRWDWSDGIGQVDNQWEGLSVAV